MSCDLRKSEVEEREKSARSWCHNYIFFISLSLLIVSNDINHRRNSKENHASARCKNSKSRITLLGEITPHAVILIGHSRKTITYHNALCLSPQNFA